MRALISFAALVASADALVNVTLFLQPDNAREILRHSRTDDGYTIVAFGRSVARDQLDAGDARILNEYRTPDAAYDAETSTVIYVVNDEYEIEHQAVIPRFKLSRDGPEIRFTGSGLFVPDSYNLAFYLSGETDYSVQRVFDGDAFDAYAPERSWVYTDDAIVSKNRGSNASRVFLLHDDTLFWEYLPQPSLGYYGEDFFLSVTQRQISLAAGDAATVTATMSSLPYFVSRSRTVCDVHVRGDTYYALLSAEADDTGASSGHYIAALSSTGSFRAIPVVTGDFSGSLLSSGVVTETCGSWKWFGECAAVRVGDETTLLCGETTHFRTAGEALVLASGQQVELTGREMVLRPQGERFTLDEEFSDAFLVMGGRALGASYGAVHRLYLGAPEYKFSLARRYKEHTLLDERLTDVVTGHEIPSFLFADALSHSACADACSTEAAWCAGFRFTDEHCHLVTDRARLGVDNMLEFAMAHAVSGEPSPRFSNYSGLCLIRGPCEHSRVENVAVGGDGSHRIYMAENPLFARTDEVVEEPLSLHPGVTVIADTGLVWQRLTLIEKDVCFARCAADADMCIGAEYTAAGECRLLFARYSFLLGSGYPIVAEPVTSGKFGFVHSSRGTARLSTVASDPWDGYGFKVLDLNAGLNTFMLQRRIDGVTLACDRSITSLRASEVCEFDGVPEYTHSNRREVRVADVKNDCRRLCELNDDWCLAVRAEGEDCVMISTDQLEGPVREDPENGFRRCDAGPDCDIKPPFNFVSPGDTSYVLDGSCADRLGGVTLGSCGEGNRWRAIGVSQADCRDACCNVGCELVEHGDTDDDVYCDVFGDIAPHGFTAAATPLEGGVCYSTTADPRKDPGTGYYSVNGAGGGMLGTGHPLIMHRRNVPVSSTKLCSELALSTYDAPALGFRMDGTTCEIFPSQSVPAAEGFTEVQTGDAPNADFVIGDGTPTRSGVYVYSRLSGDPETEEGDFKMFAGVCTDAIGLYILRVNFSPGSLEKCQRACRHVEGCRGVTLKSNGDCHVYVNWDLAGEPGFYGGYKLEKYCIVGDCEDGANDASVVVGHGTEGTCHGYLPYEAPAEDALLSTLAVALIGSGAGILLCCCVLAVASGPEDYARVSK